MGERRVEWRCQLSAEGKRCLYPNGGKDRQGIAWTSPGGHLMVRWDGQKSQGSFHRSFIEPVIDQSE